MIEMPNPLLLDSHLHLQDHRFYGILPEILLRARHSGIGRMLCNATREEDWQNVLNLGQDHPWILPFLGVHPWYADQVTPGWDQRLEAIVAANRSGIGEAGLDGKCRSAIANQTTVLSAQLDLAIKYQRPLSLHCVASWGRLVGILENRHARGSMPQVMLHAFSGSVEIMHRLLRIGCWFSFTARLVDPRCQKLRQVFLEIPLDRILLETDAPDQLPADLQKNGESSCNEPAHIAILYRKAADLRRLDFEQFTQHIWKNGEIFTNSLLPR
jgi:TatD DNase family protein